MKSIIKLVFGVGLLLAMAGCSVNKLTKAAVEGDIFTTHRLLSQRADPDYDHAGMGSPLHNAIYFGHRGIADELIRYGADIDKQAYMDGPPSKIKIGLSVRSLGINRIFGTSLMVAAAVGDIHMFDWAAGGPVPSGIRFMGVSQVPFLFR